MYFSTNFETLKNLIYVYYEVYVTRLKKLSEKE